MFQSISDLANLSMSQIYDKFHRFLLKKILLEKRPNSQNLTAKKKNFHLPIPTNECISLTTDSK